jgi:hypothetical protein
MRGGTRKKRLNTTVLENRLTDGGEAVSFTLRPACRPLPPGRFVVIYF